MIFLSKENQSAINTLSKSIIQSFKQLIEKATFNKDYQGRITQVLANNQYKVTIFGNEYSTYSACGLIFKANDSVWVTAPQNDFDRIYISGKRQ